MKFELVDRQGYIPDLVYGEAGQELSCFVPEQYQWKQVNYDNGEVDVLIDGHIWRFFFVQEGIGVKLIDGVVSFKEADSFVRDVKEKIWGAKNQEVQMLIAGTTPR